MYVKKINNEWVKFPNLPVVWENKSPFNPETEGFYEITTPPTINGEMLGNIIDDEEGNPIYSVVPSIQNQSSLTLEEIETELYQKRISIGVNTWAKISAKLRVSKEKNHISLAKYKRVEMLIKPFREELLAGQWIDAQNLFKELNRTDVGADLYDFTTDTLDYFILRIY